MHFYAGWIRSFDKPEQITRQILTIDGWNSDNFKVVWSYIVFKVDW